MRNVRPSFLHISSWAWPKIQASVLHTVSVFEEAYS